MTPVMATAAVSADAQIADKNFLIAISSCSDWIFFVPYGRENGSGTGMFQIRCNIAQL